MKIRPVSDPRNHYADVERDVTEEGPVFLTKNGYGSMVVMSLEQLVVGRVAGKEPSRVQPPYELLNRLVLPCRVAKMQATF